MTIASVTRTAYTNGTIADAVAANANEDALTIGLNAAIAAVNGVSGYAGKFVANTVSITSTSSASTLGYTAINMVSGGQFVISAGVTFTIDVPFSCGLFQCFGTSASGASVVFSGGTVTEVLPEWFGFAQSATGETNSIALQAACDSVFKSPIEGSPYENAADNGYSGAKGFATKVVLEPGLYELASTVTVNSLYACIEGNDAMLAKADTFTGDFAIASTSSSGYRQRYERIQFLNFDNGIGLDSANANSGNCVIQSCKFFNIAEDAIWLDTQSGHTMIYDCMWRSCKHDLVIVTGDFVVVRGGWIERDGQKYETATYTGDGSDTTFDAVSAPPSADDLLVYIGDTPQTITTDYTWTPGGTAVTFLSPPAIGAVITIRNVYKRPKNTTEDYDGSIINGNDLSSGVLRLEDIELIPAVQTITEPCWIKNYGIVTCDNVRFGGELGQCTAINNFASASTAYPRIPVVVSITDSHLYTGGNPAVRLFDVPNNINLFNNRGLAATGATLVAWSSLVDAPAQAAIIAGWNAAGMLLDAIKIVSDSNSPSNLGIPVNLKPYTQNSDQILITSPDAAYVPTLEMQFKDTNTAIGDVYGSVQWRGYDASTASNGIRAQHRVEASGPNGGVKHVMSVTDDNTVVLTDVLDITVDGITPTNPTSFYLGKNSYTTREMTVNIGISTTNMNITGHGLSVNDAVRFLTSGTLPTVAGVPLPAQTDYYVHTVVDANTIKIKPATTSSTAIVFNGNGTGTHSMIDMAAGAWLGLILADTTNGKCYRIQVTNGTIEAIDITV